MYPQNITPYHYNSHFFFKQRRGSNTMKVIKFQLLLSAAAVAHAQLAQTTEFLQGLVDNGWFVLVTTHSHQTLTLSHTCAYTPHTHTTAACPGFSCFCSLLASHFFRIDGPECRSLQIATQNTSQCNGPNGELTSLKLYVHIRFDSFPASAAT